MTGPTPARVIPRVLRPLQEFLQTETAGGAVLLAAAVCALIWANLPGDSYADLWNTHIDLDLDVVHLDLTLREWVNDGLMAVFFFVVGLEIKREVLRGELSGRRRAALPAAAALGGMVLPALIYLAFNAGGDGARGWGIPMATDIAFAVGALSLLAGRVPLSLKVFLLALAIVDDLGAIMVIAVFYTEDIALDWLGLAVAMFAVTAALGRVRVPTLAVYVAVAAVAWLALHESGVHATLAGVMLGLLTPIGARFGEERLVREASDLVTQMEEGRAAGGREGSEQADSALRELEDMARHSRSPLDRLEHELHPWTSYLIVPLFALANAGVDIGGEAVSSAATSRVSLGIAAGLLIGKPLGIVLFSFVAVRLGIAALPDGVNWARLAAVGVLGGIGFTVSLFITTLAFDSPELVEDAKIAILVASAIAGAVGYLALRRLSPRADAQT